MALKIAVLKNLIELPQPLHGASSDSSDVVEFERFIEIMAAGRTTLSKTDIMAAMQLYKEELQKQLVEGKTIKTPTGSFYLSAAGSMNSLDESYLPKDTTNNHEVRLHHKPERVFEDSIIGPLKILREERPDLSVPSLRAVLAAGEEDAGTIRVGGTIQIKGLRLRFDRKEAGQGVFFVDASGSRRARRSTPWSSRHGPCGPARNPGGGQLRDRAPRRRER